MSELPVSSRCFILSFHFLSESLLGYMSHSVTHLFILVFKSDLGQNELVMQIYIYARHIYALNWVK